MADPTARRTWLAIKEQFVGNCETRAVLLDAQLRNLEQGDLSVTEYCRKMKNIADTLGDLGEPVPDRTLVMSILRGLNEEFQSVRNIIKRTKPFPSFVEVRSDLMVEEITMKTPSATALVAPSGSRPANNTGGTPASSGGGSQGA
jgi:hypothetical protein